MTYTHDLVTKHTANWTTWLQPYIGQPARALEIGTFQGRSAIWFCQNILTHPDSRLICVDTFQWMNAHDTCLANIREAALTEKIHLLPISSRWLQLPPDHLDFIYIDGDHTQTAVLTDAILTWRSLKPGGTLIFDDYLLQRHGRTQVKTAVDAFLHVFAHELQILAHGYQIALRKKPTPAPS